MEAKNMPRTMKIMMTCWPLVALLAAPAALASEGDVVAVMKLKGPLAEQPDSLGLGSLLGQHAPPNMYDLLKKLRAARSDSNLKAVIFDIDQAALGLGQIQELRAQFEALRAADKDVWIFAEGLGNGTLMLGSAASRLILVPSGEVSFTGLYGEALYFKNLLDKIHVQADILHCGDFKSAGEPFYRTGPSKPAEAQQNRLLDSLFNQMIESVAKSRRLTPQRVRELVDIGTFSAKEALDAHLVDKLMYREDFVAKIKRQYGPGTKIDFNYGGEKAPKIDLENPFGLFKFFGDMMKGPKASEGTAIAVVYVEGDIVSGESDPSMFGGPTGAASGTIRKAIAEAAADPGVKALILRVDSPGGSALASDVICEAAKRFKQSGRPFIVSMGNVAASGGYYVSCLADTIFAEPCTITGSIGVVGGKIVTKGLWNWVGITGHEYKRGKHADILNTNRPFSDEERKLVFSTMTRVYGQFKGRVLEGRKGKLKGEIESLAGGRVYTGAVALEKGLVDRLGGFADAIKFTADEAELSHYELRVYPRPKTIFDMMAEIFSGKESDQKFVQLFGGGGRPAGARLSQLPAVAALLQALKTADPQKARIFERFLVQLELFSSERVQLIAPGTTTLWR